ncbi:beta-galactosidase [Arthrobacter sp. SLBN-100]|uniref:glycoside hydrolase family 2 TIM barrel-domain containing protein n=1 Tax=Arthrobacter sp. SLBN-100 TaxID=2768450 RepID=UPI00114E093D|nr:glycoside hydrolase family 2 TIM barrel-domain containing protein [Arthrobacter sp. SLBN-100]TQJ66250.1 beta-galactosidase [Arthrobacter sp. SLBN-100]
MTRSSFNQGWIVRPKTSIYGQLQGGGSEGTAVTLPHDAIRTLPRSADCTEGSRTGFSPGGVFEYTKSFDVPQEYRQQRVSVEFQGVHRDAMVFVNGAFAAQRPFGYSTFTVNLGPFLKYGETNTIRVDARSHEDSRWYTGAGITRDTFLLVTQLIHLETNGVAITTPDVDAERAVVEVAVTVTNDSLTTETVTTDSEIRDAKGTVVARGSAPVTLSPGASATTRHRLYVLEPALWSVDEPNLYTAVVSVRDVTDLFDERDVDFGIRSLKLDPMHGLRINGSTVKLRGACIHADNGLLGAAVIGRAEERRIELLKAAGFNAIRSAHNPISQPMLEACDRVGMLVMDETFDMWADGKASFDYSLSFPEWWERDVQAMVAKNFNHPSVIFYSIGNEIPETGTPLGSEWGRRLAEKVRALDGTRYVTNGINGFVSVLPDVTAMMKQRSSDTQTGGVNDAMNAGDLMNQISASPLVTAKTEESFSVLDVAGMNYGDSRYVLDRELFPNRVIVGTETFPPHIGSNWKLVEQNPHVLGDFTWTGWDYLGEAGAGRIQYVDQGNPTFEAPYPWFTAWTGDLDITGNRRPISYYRETVFGLRQKPYIAVHRPENYGRPALQGQWAWSDSISSWTWPVSPETPIKVEVYSGADEIELILNGDSVGRLPAGRENSYMALFDLHYSPGELVAVAYSGGEEQARTALRTAGDVAILSAVPDRTEINADDSDLIYIAIALQDQAGTITPTSDRVVTVQVDGAALLQGLGSGRPDTEERFDGPSCTTFNGRALAIIRPCGPGSITATITAEELEPVIVNAAAVAPRTGPEVPSTRQLVS